MKLLMIIASALLVFTGCAQVTSKSRKGAAGAGVVRAAANLQGFPATAEGLSVRGDTLDVGSRHLKRPTLFVFWASWCKPCNREAPEVVALARRMAGRLDVVGVNVDTDLDAARAFIQKHGVTYPSLRDPELVFSDALKVQGTPALVLVDRGGRELGRGKRLGQLESAMAELGQDTLSRSETLMGTSIEIVLRAPKSERATAALDAAIAEIARVENVFSTWKPDSALSQLNARAGHAVSLPDEALTLLSEARQLCELTAGRFDPTFKGADRVWDFTGRTINPPTLEQARRAVSVVDCHQLTIDRALGTARLGKSGMAVGLGGIAKGYAVDRAAGLLEAAGYRDFVVNAGGDLLARGRNDGQLWQVGIRHPRKADTQLAILPVSGYAVATSGDYERFFEHDGTRYHHILDPKTGFPATGCQSVTILARRAALADALATGVFVMGPEAGIALVDRLDGVEALVVDADGQLHASRGLPVTLAGAKRAPALAKVAASAPALAGGVR